MKMFKLLILLLVASCTNSKQEVEEEQDSNEAQASQVCEVSFYLNNSEVLTEAKGIWNSEIDISDNLAVSACFNELNSASDELLPFYILVVDRIMANTDGALTEMSSVYSYKFINRKTSLFFDFFENKHCLSVKYQKYYSNWVQHYAYYLSAMCDDDTRDYDKCTTETIQKLKNNCVGCKMEPFLTNLKNYL